MLSIIIKRLVTPQQGLACAADSPSALMLRTLLVAACLLCAAHAASAQLDEINVEGSILPEEVPADASAYSEPYDIGAQQQLYVVAIDGQPMNGGTSADDELQDINASPASQDLLGPLLSDLPALSVDGTAAAATPAAAPVVSSPPPPPPPVPPISNPAASAALAPAVAHLGVPPAGSKIPGRYVVFFNSDVSSVGSGIDRLQQHVADKLSQISSGSDPGSSAVGIAAVPSSPPVSFHIRARLGSDDEADSDSGLRQQVGIAATGVASAASRSRGSSSSSSSSQGSQRGSSSSRLRGLVVETPSGVKARALYRALRTSKDVKKVVQDRIISITQDRCTSAKSLAGISNAAQGLRWANCKVAGAKVYWFGERCGGNLAKTRWLGMYALNATTNAMIPGCLQYRKTPDGDPWNTAHMGQCGVAPTAAPNLPVSVCADADSAGCISAAKLGLLRLTLSKAVTCNGGSSTQLILQGSRCGPGLGFVQWGSVMMPDGAGCSYSRSAIDRKFNSDWLGSCGVTPSTIHLPGTVCTAAQVSAGVDEYRGGNFQKNPPPPPLVRPPPPPPRPSPPPPPPSPPPPPPPSSPPPSPPPPPPPSPSAASAAAGVPSEDLAANEFVPTGIQRIEAVYKAKVPLLAQAPVQGVVVAVVDTGVDSSHPDLNVIGGMNFVADEPDLKFSDDSHGHGTHVAGTIGAKNQGKGIVGVAPGIGIYGLRVLKADGNGVFSDLLRAYDHLVTNGRKLGIRVVNLSLSGSGDANDEECTYIQQLVDQGITVVTAAGNAGVSLLGEVPAACAGALAVTAVSDSDGLNTNDFPATWSNFLPLPDTADVTSRVLAAPGDAITSTYPMNKAGFNGYAKMSGTSMACPHVSGIAALCYASGFCKSNTATELSKVLGPSLSYNQYTQSYRYPSDPLTNPLPDKYYGYMAWGRKFWGRGDNSEWYPVELIQRTRKSSVDFESLDLL